MPLCPARLRGVSVTVSLTLSWMVPPTAEEATWCPWILMAVPALPCQVALTHLETNVF